MHSLSSQHSNTPYWQESFISFLQQQDEDYLQRAYAIPLFKGPFPPLFWSQLRKQAFVRAFYHARGHFHDFLWLIGNHTSSVEVKKIVLDNIAEEFNGSAKSHEQMYWLFAQSHGVNIQDEIAHKAYYLPFLKDFNQKHLDWLYTHDEHHQLAAFAAYERLDNIDYKILFHLAQQFPTPPKGLIFFKTHIYVQHYDNINPLILAMWKNNKEIVKYSFDFIYNHQLKMWEDLSHYIFSL